MPQINTQLIIEEDTQTWKLIGELNFNTVGNLLTICRKANLPQTVDLHSVTLADSAGLAFLIELIKWAQPTPITFHNIPQQVLIIATVNDVQLLLTEFPSTLSR